jgi:hypothetical protein
MSTFKEIRGTLIKSLSSDPSNPGEGEMWYNSTSQTLKGYVLAPASTSSSGAVNTGRTQLGSTGTLTAGIMFGGETPSLTGVTEEFDGSTFSNGGTCPATKSDMHSSGTQTAALWGGGSPSSSGSFEYNGSSWTGVGAMTFAGRDFTGGGVGIQTAALQVGGFISPGNYSAVMQEYNGTSWSNIPQTFPTGPNTGGFASCGTQTACLSSGGPSGATATLSWDGSSWTTENSLGIGASGAVQRGTVSDAIMATGHPASPPTYGVEIQTWDGTNWSTSPATFSIGKAQAAGFGNSAGLAIATGAPSFSTSSEIYSGQALATQTFTTS